jgi:hypothetical protein
MSSLEVMCPYLIDYAYSNEQFSLILHICTSLCVQYALVIRFLFRSLIRSDRGGDGSSCSKGEVLDETKRQSHGGISLSGYFSERMNPSSPLEAV